MVGNYAAKVSHFSCLMIHTVPIPWIDATAKERATEFLPFAQNQDILITAMTGEKARHEFTHILFLLSVLSVLLQSTKSVFY
jgi:hypothetical protein